MSEAIQFVPQVFQRFAIQGTYGSARPYGSGHINETFLVTAQENGVPRRYIFQHLNTSIFPDPHPVMENIQQVTGHLRKKLAHLSSVDLERRVLTLMSTREGGVLFEDPTMGYWRAYLFIDEAQTFDILETPQQAFEAALAFGTFQHLLSDYDGPPLVETTPDFHHTVKRFQVFQAAVKADPLGRAHDMAAEIDFALHHEALAHLLINLKASGAIPERITHNDTKLNNVLLDAESGKGLCVLDLDTVMPGLSLYDFGDMVRSACNPVAEDCPDPSRVIARGDVFEALVAGYLQGTAGALLPIEKDHLLTSGQLLSFECGLRFLTDHLNGDTYFRIHRPSQNLDRGRTQFALVASLEAQRDHFLSLIPRS